MIFSTDEAIEKLEEFHASLVALVHQTNSSRDIQHGEERLARWNARVAHWLSQEVSTREAARLAGTTGGLRHAHPAENFTQLAEAYSSFLRALISDMQEDPDYWEDVLLESPEEDYEEDYEEDDGEDDGEDESVSERSRPCVFIGHGRSPHWSLIQRFLEKDLGLATLAFESESRVGHHIVEVLERMMEESDFAVIVLTAEDVTEGGLARARQNVVHEVGLWQGKLGFNRTVVALQNGVEEFSNISGLQQLRFDNDAVEQCFEGLRAALAREEIT